MNVRRNDRVLIIAGNYQGKRGRVLKVFPERNRVIVEGINFIKRHTKSNPKNPQGGIIEKEASIHASNVMVICPKCDSATRIGMKIIKDETRGKWNRIRTCKKCGEMIVSAA